MKSHGCINGTLDGNKYSSPVPVIGLYIAAATLVCMLLMIYDLLVGLYTRKRWLPGKLFKLDSITLTLVSVAVKLTVDLTTPMPSVMDQLSKLCGTSLMCAYMGFIMHSVGVMNDSTNMYSLSILVITVIVNMCIQISTGVVVLFIPEHIIILCFMLLLLVILWIFARTTKVVKRHTRETNKIFLRRSKQTVLERLKTCYLYGYSCNPQFLACKDHASLSVGGLNLFCLAILIQAAYRSFIMKSEKLCIGQHSDYDWSMPIIVVTQILTVIVGTSVSLSRYFTMAWHLGLLFEIGEGEPYESNPIWETSDLWRFLSLLMLAIGNVVIFIIMLPVAVCFQLVMMIIFESGDNAATEEFKHLMEENIFIGIDEWTLTKGLREMEKEREVSKSQPNEVFGLLSKITPSQQSQVEHSDRVGPINGENIPVSTLSVVLLIRIAQVSLPKDFNSFLVKTFREVYEFLYFIEESLYLTSPEFAKKLEVAKRVWLARDFSHLVVKTFDKFATGGQSQPDTNCAHAIIAEVKSKMPVDDMIDSELSIIEKLINGRQYSSIKELCDYIEQLYVDMLHVILAQFPTATFKALTESPGDDDYHKKVRLALKFISKIELLEDRIQWKFPQGSNLLGLITNPAVLATEEEGNAAVNNHDDVLHATEDTVAVPIHDDDVIIEVGDSTLRTIS